jgi:hypothetical protein
MNTEAIRFIAKAILAQNTVLPNGERLKFRYGELVRHGLLHRRLDQLSHH